MSILINACYEIVSIPIDRLKRKRLWKEAALIVKLCPLEEISSESQVGVVMVILYVTDSPPPLW